MNRFNRDANPDSNGHHYVLMLVILLVALFAALLIYALLPTTTPVLDVAAESKETLQAQIEQGRYVAIAGDCMACHTARGGKPFAGGLPIFAHIGTVYSSNITPDKVSGIGGYSLNDFDRAVRYGIKPDGTTMYPAMPFPSYARMTDQDLRALYAYFMHEVAPVKAEDRESDIHWPMSLRWPLAVWRKIYAPATAVVQFDMKRYPDQNIARGAYLVQTLGHCGTCHTPRAKTTLQELAMDDSHPAYLAGGKKIDGSVAVNLRGNNGAGLGAWSAQQIADVLKTGRNANSAMVGAPTTDMVVHSTQFMSDQDLQAIAAYLKTLPAAPDVKTSLTPRS